MPHTSTQPARTTFYSSDLATNVRRTYGYRGYCACGWEGPVRAKHGDARFDTKVHRHQEHRQ